MRRLNDHQCLGQQINRRLTCFAQHYQIYQRSTRARVTTNTSNNSSERPDKQQTSSQPETLYSTSSLASIDNEPLSDDSIHENILAGRVGEAAHQCNARLQLRSPPNITVCVSLIRGLLNANKYPAAWQIYTQLRDLNICVNYGTHHLLIVSALKAQQLHDVVDLLRHMEYQGMVLNTATLVVVVNGLLRSQKRGTPFHRVAWQLWVRLRESGEVTTAVTYTTGMHACVSFGQFKEARALLEEMTKMGIPPTATQFNVLMKGYCRRGNTAAARKVFKQMRSLGIAPDVVTFNVLMHCFVKRGELLRAKAVLDKAVREGVTLDVWTYTIYMQGLCKAGEPEAAEGVLLVMRESGMTPTKVTYGTLIHGYVQKGKLPEAERLLSQMQSQGLTPSTIVYNSIISAHVGTLSSEGFSTALKTLRTMAALGVPPGADTFNIVMDALVKLPDLKGAARIFAQMTELEVPVDATLYTTLIKIFKVSGQPDVALKVFAEMRSNPEAEVDTAAWNSLTDVLACAGRMGEAAQAAAEAARTAEERGQPPPVEAFGALVNGYHQRNDVDETVAVLRSFLKMGGVADKKMYDQVIDLCLRNDDLKTAFQIVRAMELAGVPVDKDQYKAWFDKYHRPVGALPSGPPSSFGGAAGRGSFFNPYLERFKFWLGLPNRYYDSGAWP